MLIKADWISSLTVQMFIWECVWLRANDVSAWHMKTQLPQQGSALCIVVSPLRSSEAALRKEGKDRHSHQISGVIEGV